MEKHSLLRALSLALIITTAIAVSSCRTQTVVLPEIHRRDSVRITSTNRYDSIRTAEWHFLFQKGDTVFKTDSVVKEKIVEVEVHDTVTKNTRDSVPYPVEVPIEVPTPIPRFYVRCTIAFFLLLLAIIAYIALRIHLRR